jgi:hypothetical protein
MSIHDNSPSVASDGTRRGTGVATARIDSKPVRCSAQKKTEVVLRLLRGEAIDLVSREVGVLPTGLQPGGRPFLKPARRP